MLTLFLLAAAVCQVAWIWSMVNELRAECARIDDRLSR